MTFPPKGNLKSAIGKKLGQPTAPDDMSGAMPGPMPGPMPSASAPSPTPPSASDPSPMPPMGGGDEAQGADPQDIQIITEASAHDPVIAAIARVLGIGA